MMNAEIEGTDEDYVKTYVTDNAGAEHNLTIEKRTGEIAYHDQDGYPDKAAERTPENNEHISQARRYARYHVAQETEHDVLPWDRDQKAMNRTKDAIESLSDDEFEEYFGTYFDQINSRLPGVKAPVPEPDSVDEDQFVLYMFDLYLDEAGQIEATSDIHFLYLAKDRKRQVVLGRQPFERDPDARLQVKPNYLPSLDVAQEFFAYHLRCQIRDSYLLRGEGPPEQYRVIGSGLYDGTTRYLREDRPYRPYHKLHAEIPGYTLEFDYGFGEEGKEMAKLADAVADND